MKPAKPKNSFRSPTLTGKDTSKEPTFAGKAPLFFQVKNFSTSLYKQTRETGDLHKLRAALLTFALKQGRSNGVIAKEITNKQLAKELGMTYSTFCRIYSFARQEGFIDLNKDGDRLLRTLRNKSGNIVIKDDIRGLSFKEIEIRFRDEILIKKKKQIDYSETKNQLLALRKDIHIPADSSTCVSINTIAAELCCSAGTASGFKNKSRKTSWKREILDLGRPSKEETKEMIDSCKEGKIVVRRDGTVFWETVSLMTILSVPKERVIVPKAKRVTTNLGGSAAVITKEEMQMTEDDCRLEARLCEIESGLRRTSSRGKYYPRIINYV